MPKVSDYVLTAPFTLEELVAAANSILRDKPRMEVSARTVRYYISRGLLPGAIGSPKNARYRIEHLERLVAIRQHLDQGQSLEQIAEKFESGDWSVPADALVYSNIPDNRHSRAYERNLTTEELVPRLMESRVVRVPITQDVTLEIPEDADRRRVFQELFAKLREYLKDT